MRLVVNIYKEGNLRVRYHFHFNKYKNSDKQGISYQVCIRIYIVYRDSWINATFMSSDDDIKSSTNQSFNKELLELPSGWKKVHSSRSCVRWLDYWYLTQHNLLMVVLTLIKLNYAQPCTMLCLVCLPFNTPNCILLPGNIGELILTVFAQCTNLLPSGYWG